MGDAFSDFFAREAPPVVRPPSVAPSITKDGPPATVSGGNVYQDFFLRGPIGKIITSPGKEQASSVQDLRNLDVDVESGAPAAARAEMSLTPPEREHEALTRLFGEGGFYRSNVGLVVKAKQPDGTTRDTLFDEVGFTVKDLADMAGSAPEVAASIAATAAAVTITGTVGVPSLALLAVIAGVSGQLGGVPADTVQALRTGGIDMELIESIAKRRTVNAAIDMVAGFLLTAGVRSAKAGAQFLAGPFARRMAQSPQSEIVAAAERLGVRNVMTPGELTGSPTVLQAEAVASKIPGSREVMERLKQAETAEMRAVQETIIGRPPTAAKTGEDISGVLTKQKAAAEAEIEQLRFQVGQALAEESDRFAKTLHTRSVSTNEAGQMARTGVGLKWQGAKEKQEFLENEAQDAIAALPVEAQAFAGTNFIKATALRLREQFPKTKTIEKLDTGILDEFGRPIIRERAKTETIREYMPAAVKRFLGGANKLPENITVEELRNLRKVLNDAIDDGAVFPGVSTSNLKALATSVTAQIKSARANAPTPEIGEFLQAAAKNYADTRPLYEQGIIQKIMRAEGQPGAINNDQVLPELFRLNQWEDAGRVMSVLGEKSLEVQAARRAVWDDMLHASRDSVLGDGAVDPKLLAKQYDKLRPETKAMVFGAEQEKVERYIRGLAANARIVEFGTKSTGITKIDAMLESAAKKEVQLARDFDNSLVKPIIKGELDTAAMSPELFVRHAMSKNVAEKDLAALLDRLPEEQKGQFRERLLVHLFERASKRASDPTDKIVAMIRETSEVGDQLADIMLKEFGQSPSESMGRLRLVLGDDTVVLLKDVATVEAARAHGQSVAKAAGGLVGGSIVANFLGLKFGNAASLVKFKIVAEMMRSAGVRKWLTSGIKLPDRTKRSTVAQLVAPQITAIAARHLGEESETARDIGAYFTTFREAAGGG